MPLQRPAPQHLPLDLEIGVIASATQRRHSAALKHVLLARLESGVVARPIEVGDQAWACRLPDQDRTGMSTGGG